MSPKKREELAQEILRIIEKNCIVKLSPAEIDKVVENGSRLNRLNRLEARAMAEIIRNLNPNIAYVDASDVIPERFGLHISEELPFKLQIISEHKADKKYPIVSAASIIAKVERDKSLAEIRERHGDCGSGYPTDKKTIIFLKEWVKTHEEYPEFVRKSWKPAKKMKKENDTHQKQLV